jgi:ATP-dependent protease HslVU (ClpYQ) peptidase subunit
MAVRSSALFLSCGPSHAIRKAMRIASTICIYTNGEIIVEELGA